MGRNTCQSYRASWIRGPIILCICLIYIEVLKLLSMVSPTPTPPVYSGDFHISILELNLNPPTYKGVNHIHNPLHSYFTHKETPLSLEHFYISIWFKYLKTLKISDLWRKYPYFSFLERTSERMFRPQEYLSLEIFIIFPTIGNNSTRKAVRFAPHFPLKSPHTPGVGDTIDNCIISMIKSCMREGDLR